MIVFYPGKIRSFSAETICFFFLWSNVNFYYHPHFVWHRWKRDCPGNIAVILRCLSLTVWDGLWHCWSVEQSPSNPPKKCPKIKPGNVGTSNFSPWVHYVLPDGCGPIVDPSEGHLSGRNAESLAKLFPLRATGLGAVLPFVNEPLVLAGERVAASGLGH